MTELEAPDRLLLEHLQAHFPLVPRPYTALAQAVGLQEAEVLERIQKLRDAGLIREISAIFDTRRLGYQSTLVAFHVADSALEKAAGQVSAHAGVSHNYARPHHYNLWFTLAVPPGKELVPAIDGIARHSGVDDWLNLPAVRVFKIRTYFKMVPGDRPSGPCGHVGSKQDGRPFEAADIPYVRALQRDLELVSRPFTGPASRIPTGEEELLAKAKELQVAGIMRRFGAVLRHRKVGFTANGMACWAVPPSRMDEVGYQAAGHPQVSHCYQRPAYPPHWPYSLFTMIHGQSQAEVNAIVAQIARESGIDDYEVLYSNREFKKERVRYFEEEA